jgi:hypothetical protein
VIHRRFQVDLDLVSFPDIHGLIQSVLIQALGKTRLKGLTMTSL